MVSKYKKSIFLLENLSKTKQRDFKLFNSKLFPSNILIYNGRKFVTFKLKELQDKGLFNYSLGSFSLTRSVGRIHEKKKKQKKGKKK